MVTFLNLVQLVEVRPVGVLVLISLGTAGHLHTGLGDGVQSHKSQSLTSGREAVRELSRPAVQPVLGWSTWDRARLGENVQG